MDQTQTATAHLESVSDKVVRQVADVEKVDPLDLTPPLYEIINPDALDEIFASTPTAGRMDGKVTFSYMGYEVTVGPDGVVEVVAG